MARPKKESDQSKEIIIDPNEIMNHENWVKNDAQENEVIDIKMALPIGFKIKLTEKVAKEFIEKGYLK